MDPKIWEEPEQFLPERFLNESGEVVGKERIMPFSIGIYTNSASFTVHRDISTVKNNYMYCKDRSV